LIKNGTLVTAEKTFQADILIQDEKVYRVAPTIEADSAVTVDASGKLILPGGVDPHVHLDLPMFDTVSSDDHYTGHKAAAFGGTTTVMDFVPLTSPSPSGRGVRGEGEIKFIPHLPPLLNFPLHIPMPAAFLARGNKNRVRVLPLGSQRPFPHGLRLGSHKNIFAETLQLQTIAAIEQGVVLPICRFKQRK